MPNRRARVRRASPSLVPALLVFAAEVLVVVLIVAWRQQVHSLCVQAQRGRTSNNLTLRAPLRQFARDAARARAESATRETGAQRRTDLAAAASHRAIAARVVDLPPIKC